MGGGRRVDRNATIFHLPAQQQTVQAASESSALDAIAPEVESRVGCLQFRSRCHKLPKTIQDDYDLLGESAGGGFSDRLLLAVLRGNIVDPQRRFAVKRLSMDRVDPEKREEIESEVKVLLCLDHPLVVRLHDVYETESHLDLVMEHLEGGELFDRVESLGRFSEPQAASALHQVLLALGHVHSAGAAHRDVKPENLVYESHGGDVLKLIDFGFSLFVDGEFGTCLSRLCGTEDYTAPEVFNGSYSGHSCDLWSVGVVAFVLLVGGMPFHGEGKELSRNVRAASYSTESVAWSGVSDGARAFVRALMEPAPEKRLDVHGALAHPWLTANLPRPERRVPTTLRRALSIYPSLSRSQRFCLSLLAWSLPSRESAKLREIFLTHNIADTGVLSSQELCAMSCTSPAQASEICAALREAKLLGVAAGYDDGFVRYSDLLGAYALATRGSLGEGLVQDAFRRYEASGVNSCIDDCSRVLCDDVRNDKFGGLSDTVSPYAVFAAHIFGVHVDTQHLEEVYRNKHSTKGCSARGSNNQELGIIADEKDGAMPMVPPVHDSRDGATMLAKGGSSHACFAWLWEMIDQSAGRLR